MLRTKPRPLCTVGKCSATELCVRPWFFEDFVAGLKLTLLLPLPGKRWDCRVHRPTQSLSTLLRPSLPYSEPLQLSSRSHTPAVLWVARSWFALLYQHHYWVQFWKALVWPPQKINCLPTTRHSSTSCRKTSQNPRLNKKILCMCAFPSTVTACLLVLYLFSCSRQISFVTKTQCLVKAYEGTSLPSLFLLSHSAGNEAGCVWNSRSSQDEAFNNETDGGVSWTR